MIGILLINLGTPEAPTESAVKNYLNEFLSDPYVITLPKMLRDFLVQKIILPTRPKKSAIAYQKIWTSTGSPLLTNSMALQKALSEKMGEEYCVQIGMRYGNPTITSALRALKNCTKIIILPLFPQFSNATSQSAIDFALAAAKKNNLTAEIKIIRDFYNQPAYTNSMTKIIREAFEKNPTDFLLLSYHGLPKKQDKDNLYRDQCFATSQLIINQLNWPTEKYQTSFQSRLGLTPWIQPYTDRILLDLQKKGITSLSVACPSFVVDCVETLEEINIRLREQWMRLGGKSFHCIPCLNANAAWVGRLSDWLMSMSGNNESEVCGI